MLDFDVKYPIHTAPRDGTVIWVMHEDCGSFPMRWDSAGTNWIAQPEDEKGIWVTPDGSFTWSEYDGAGPSHWAPYSPS